MERSAELRGLLSEIAREHGINRALMRQELTFLSHLTRLIGQEPEAGYARPGANSTASAPSAPAVYRALDLQA
jgi:transposase-like protein